MKKLSTFLLIVLLICVSALPAWAAGVFSSPLDLQLQLKSDENKENADHVPGTNITFSVDGDANIFLKTVDGHRAGIDPVSGRSFSEIEGAVISSENGKTFAEFPADNVFLIWLNAPEGSLQTAFRAEITAGDWSSSLIQLYSLGEDPTLVISGPDHFLSEEGLVFEKLTIYSKPDAFPAFQFNTTGGTGKCTILVDPTFSLLSAKESVIESDAELVLTYFPDYSMASVWIAALENYDDFQGSKFMMNTRISCTDGQKTVSAKSLTNNMPVLSENGIFMIDFSEFMNASDAYFSGDMDGDDEYELSSAAGIFEFETTANAE